MWWIRVKMRRLISSVGNDNRQDILNTQLTVLNRLQQKLRKGTPHQDGYHLEGSASMEAFYDRFENELAGWVSTFEVVTMNRLIYATR
jgi:hypothetical protein